MKIEIYRFGKYVNSVKNEEELRQWIISNVPYHNEEFVLPSAASIEKCTRVATNENYSFKVVDELMDKIMNVAKIEEVAAEFVSLKKKGVNYVYDCPMCGGRKCGTISPKYQIYKCFSCGKSGNVFNFVMEVKNVTFAEAEKYIKEFYNID